MLICTNTHSLVKTTEIERLTVETCIPLRRAYHGWIGKCKLRLVQNRILVNSSYISLTILNANVANSFCNVPAGRVGVTLPEEWSIKGPQLRY